VSVEESVIQACKTRTRPIMITALALVAGSSVILGDPIFKGMAISLAFGVMVSTVLTLVVIPLGCISAADSLKELAFAGGGEPPAAAEPQARTGPEAPAPAAARSASALRGRLAGVLSMAWLVVTGILRFAWYGLTVLVGRMRRPAATPRAQAGPAPTPAPAGPVAAPTGRPAAGFEAAPAEPPAGRPESAARRPRPVARPVTPAAAETGGRPTAQEPAEPAPAGAAAGKPERVPGRPAEETAEPGTAERATISRIRPETLESEGPPAPPARATPGSARPAGPGPEAQPDSRPQPAAGTAKEPTSLAASRKALLRKRRGIRLKPDMPGLDEDQADAERR
jgi:hypothetical protein